METTSTEATSAAAADVSGAVVELRDIRKEYPGVVALDGVSAELYPGEVLGVVGENGAGKSTMLKILAGLEMADSGEYLVGGRDTAIHSHADALALGVEIVPQEVSLVPGMSIAENICLGDYEKGFLRPTRRSNQYVRARILADRVGLDVQLDMAAGGLSLAQQRLVVVARALARGSRVLIFDEPSVGLESKDAEHLLEVVRGLRAEGVALAYCSHNLDEIEEIADRIMVLRDGERIWTGGRGEASRASLVSMIVGETAQTSNADRGMRRNSVGEDVLLQLDRISGDAFSDVSLELRAGEIVGLAGLTGSGRSEVLRAIVGAEDRHSGTMRVRGESFDPSSPREAIAASVLMMPEDRRGQGLISAMSVRANASLARFESVSRGPLITPRHEAATVKPLLEKWRVTPPDPEKVVGLLSGGNQQKVLFVRSAMSGADVVLLDEPTSGVDVGAREELHELIRAMVTGGKAVFVVSSDLAELAELADRALVMREGSIVAELQGDELTEGAILHHCYESANGAESPAEAAAKESWNE